MNHQHPLWQQPTLAIRTTRSGDGQTAEVLLDGRLLAGSDDGGELTSADGELLARVPLRNTKPQGLRRRTNPTELLLAVTAPDNVRQGALRVRAFRFTPLGKRVTADVEVGGDRERVGRLEAVDRKGDEVAIASDALGEVARLRQVDHDRGLRRSVTTWELTVAPSIDDPRLRVTSVAGLVRYAKLRAAVGDLLASERR